jgi:hypothetical protein
LSQPAALKYCSSEYAALDEKTQLGACVETLIPDVEAHPKKQAETAPYKTVTALKEKNPARAECLISRAGHFISRAGHFIFFTVNIAPPQDSACLRSL